MTDMIEEKEKIILETGDIVTINDVRYRVLSLDTRIVVAELDTSKLHISTLDIEAVIDPILDGKYKVDKYVVPDIAVDLNNKKYVQRMHLISDIKDKYDGDILRFVSSHDSSCVRSLMEKYDIKSYTTFMYIIRLFIQGGLDFTALMPIKHVYPDRNNVNYIVNRTDSIGRNVYILKPDDYKNMNKVIEMYEQRKFRSLREAYKYLKENFYHEITTDENGNNLLCIKGYGNKPTERQFRYYYYIKTPVMDRKLAREHLREFINNERIHTGGKMEDAPYPGALVEIDACEVDVSLVGTYRSQYSIGRPTLYIMKDVYSKLILAMSLGFSKNSREALFKVFGNLAADKTKFCERYGIYGVTPDMWPSCIIPQRVRCDRGADFKSKEFSRVCQELDTIRDLVMGGVGSMKGDIEQFFHQFEVFLAQFVQNRGLILKEYGSKHNTEAVLNILDLERMCILYILYYNSKVMSSYPATVEMEEAHIRLSPIGIWNYGIENIGTPMPIGNKEQYLNTLLMHGTAKINIDGIHFKNLIYSGSAVSELMEIMLKNQKRKTDIEILFDPDNIQKVKYCQSNGKVATIYLNTRLPQFKGLELYTFAMWSKYKKYKDKRNGLELEGDENLDARVAALERGIVEDATNRSPVKPSPAHMRENREFETNMDARRESTFHVMETECDAVIEDNKQYLLPESTLEDSNATCDQTDQKYSLPLDNAETDNNSEEDIEYDDDYDPQAHLQSLYKF